MIIIAAVDDENGMMFNRRRLSQDNALRSRILELAKDGRLRMNGYSFKQFEKMAGAENICVGEDFLEKAQKGEYCFIEDVSAAQYSDKTEKVVLFKWNRKYPKDFYFDIDLNGAEWRLEKTEEFPGSSHEKITMEIYLHV